MALEGGLIPKSPSPFPRRFASRAPSLSRWEREGAPKARKGEGDQGFTLIELMVVLFIIGLVAGAVVLALPGDSAALSEDADRFAARVAAARDEAVVSARPIAVWIAPSGYGFDARQDRKWVPLNARTLANRDWNPGTIARIEGATGEGERTPEDQGRARFWFDATGLPNMPVTVVLARGTNSDRIVISATGEVGRPK
ncbi:type II secretion system minor pseudopilin GspH [Blastomonas natatoria]